MDKCMKYSKHANMIANKHTNMQTYYMFSLIIARF